MKKQLEDISHRDFLIIYHGALLMGHIDNVLAPKEKEFLLELADLGHINNKEIDAIKAAKKDHIFVLIKSLSSKRARKVFLLVMATMALADNILDKNEVRFLEELSRQLNVGTIRLEGLTYKKSEQMVLKLLNSVTKEAE